MTLYDLTTELGKGAFGEVWKIRRNDDTRMRYAVKMLQVADLTTANSGVEEATKVAMCAHPNLVSLKEQFFHYRSGFSLFSTPYSFCMVHYTSI